MPFGAGIPWAEGALRNSQSEELEKALLFREQIRSLLHKACITVGSSSPGAWREDWQRKGAAFSEEGRWLAGKAEAEAVVLSAPGASNAWAGVRSGPAHISILAVPCLQGAHHCLPTLGAGTHLAPPPPSTKAMALPVSTRARREKSECRSGVRWKTRSYISTSLGKLLREKTRRGQRRCR